MRGLRIAVFGGGHLGTIHAKLLQQVSDVELTAIIEPNQDRAHELRSQFDCRVTGDIDQVIAQREFDAAVVAAPTNLHHQLGLQLLERRIHVLMEKPLAASPAACAELVETAESRGAVLQVGHVERFNPAWTAVRGAMGTPRFISATREGPLTFRSMDAGVVLDLMIHDIDLILSVVPSQVAKVQAIGFDWTGPSEDIAQTRLTFANGCVANLSASRVASEPRRQMTLYGNDWCTDIDFAARQCRTVEARSGNWQARTYSPDDRAALSQRLFQDVLARHVPAVPDANPILEELCDFARAIRSGTQPKVTGRDGLAAVSIADEVIQRIQQRTPTSAPYLQPERKAG